ncbi:AlpA family transcriptional regulator [Microbacterium sp.]|uniref:helix-turn-helix transcriptional regulator n=1 Tax=Microbacterium sp. TaxID=51671 RepID=UPI0027350921|nr:helix-turn-helix domain-containing protein [Microbacterium sp.]MDP3951163.1 DNA-binding protein [Microbacterium sp.]
MTTQIMGALMDAKTTSIYLGVSMRTLEGWRARGIGPKYVRLSATKGVRYRMEDIVAWMRTREDAR